MVVTGRSIAVVVVDLQMLHTCTYHHRHHDCRRRHHHRHRHHLHHKEFIVHRLQKEHQCSTDVKIQTKKMTNKIK